MPRQSAASQAITPVYKTARQLLRPPADLDAVESAVFADLVLSMAPDHFTARDLPLLSLLARSIVLERTAAGELKAAGYVCSEDGPKWFDILRHATKEIRATMRMLSMSPASDQRKGKPQVEPVNIYAKMAILEGRANGPDSN